MFNKLLLILGVFISFNIQAGTEVLKDYTFDAKEFRGTPEMLIDKGKLNFITVNPSATGWAKQLPDLVMEFTAYDNNSNKIQANTWNKGKAAKKPYKDRVQICDQESNIDKCDFKIHKLYFDFINEEEGIMYYGFIGSSRYAYFYFNEEQSLETHQERIERLMEEDKKSRSKRNYF